MTLSGMVESVDAMIFWMCRFTGGSFEFVNDDSVTSECGDTAKESNEQSTPYEI